MDMVLELVVDHWGSALLVVVEPTSGYVVISLLLY